MYSYLYECDRWKIFYAEREVANIDPNTLSLKDFRFDLNNRKDFHVLQLLWTMNSNCVYPCMWDVTSATFEWEISATGLNLVLSAVNTDKTIRCVAKVLFKNPNHNNRLSIVVDSGIEILADYDHKGFIRTVDGKEYGIIEYTDPYPMHAVGPSTTAEYYWQGVYVKGQETHTDEWRKRYRKIIHGSDGEYIGQTLNHFFNFTDMKMKNGSILGLFDDPLGALVFELLEDNGLNHSFALCTWGYDLHFAFDYPNVTDIDGRWCYFHFKKGEKFDVKYSFEMKSKKEAIEIENKTRYNELTSKQIKALDKPIITYGINRFNQKCEEGDLFSFAWNYSENVTWKKDDGYDDNFCLDADATEKSANISLNYGSDDFGIPVKINRRYRCYAFVKSLTETAKIDLQFTFDVPIFKDYHSLPVPSTVFCKEVNLTKGEFEMIELTGVSPSEYATRARVELNILSGNVLVDNFYFGECD